MNQELVVNGEHIFTLQEILPFVYRYRLYGGKWRYASKTKATWACDQAEAKAIDDIDWSKR